MSLALSIKYQLKTGPLRPPAKALYQLYKRFAYPTARIAAGKAALLDGLASGERDLLAAVSPRISCFDGMYDGNTGHYFSVGLSAIRCINEAIGDMPVRSILDLPCGFGRVMRFFPHRFPGAGLTAVELDRKAVDFCVAQFGAEGLYSQPDFATLDFGKKFDLIWCGSLITHLDSQPIKDLLSLFNRHLAPGGVVVFSTHGQRAAENFRISPMSYGVPHESAEAFVSRYESVGFAYLEYPNRPGYGTSLTSSAWIRKQLAEQSGWRLIHFAERRWDDFHDVFAVGKD